MVINGVWTQYYGSTGAHAIFMFVFQTQFLKKNKDQMYYLGPDKTP